MSSSDNRPCACRLLVADLDGTLLNTRKQLTAATLAMLREAARAGIITVPATGRFYGAIPEPLRTLPSIRYYITANGACVMDTACGRTVYEAELAPGDAAALLDFLKQKDCIYDCYIHHAAYIPAAFFPLLDAYLTNPYYLALSRQLDQPVEDLPGMIAAQQLPVQKILVYPRSARQRQSLAQELTAQFPMVCVSGNDGNHLEINHAHANKGDALRALAAYLRIDLRQTAAFGDGLNDLSMIQAAGTGFAMANACPELKQCADRLLPGCDENGAAYGIWSLISAQAAAPSQSESE